MSHYLTILMLVCISNFSNAQEISLKLDDIECYRIPWQLKSGTNIHKNEIISKESFPKWRVKNVVRDEQALQYFVEINLIDTSKVLSLNESIDDIDARAVIVLKYNNGSKDTIVFNGSSSYWYGGTVYLSNIKLLLWIQEYNPLADPKSEFIKSEDVSKLKEKHNFMLK